MFSSLSPDSSQAAHQTGCFTGDSTAQLETGEMRVLSELRVGDKVLSMDNDGQLKYSEVFMFLDRDEQQKREFVRIETDDGSSITATPSHLIYTWENRNDNPTTVQSLADFQFAERIQIGDFVLTNVNGTLEPRRVTKITAELHRGVYAPLTYDGTIVVNSIAASCYALVEKHSLAHIGFMPMRTLHRIEELFGSAANDINGDRPHGIHWYARALNKLKDTILPSKWFYHS